MSDDPDNPSPGSSRRRPARRGGLDVEVVTTPGGRPAAASGLAAWLAYVAEGRIGGAVTVALVSDARIRALNRRYRRTDRVTDVLSFPAFAPSALRRGQPPAPSALRRGRPPAPSVRRRGTRVRDPGPPVSGLRPPLGDIVIATGRARRQAREAGHGLTAELRLLALHGLLHLAGFDHERDAGRMARLERTLRRRGGLETGLIERARRAAPARAARRAR